LQCHPADYRIIAGFAISDTIMPPRHSPIAAQDAAHPYLAAHAGHATRWSIRALGLAIAALCAGAHAAPVSFATEHVIGPDDTPAMAAEKAAKVLPRPRPA